MKHDRWLCGWRVSSDLPLPDLLPWTGDERRADLEIRIGSVPEGLPNVVYSGPLVQVAENGVCRFGVRGVAAYLIEGGTCITVDPAMDPVAPDIRVFLLGTVFGILCHQRGLLPLHASCVRIGNKAVAFSGPSGIGKSTLAAAFLRRGYEILADDVTVVDTAAPGGPVVLPAFPRLKLWRDAMKSFAISTHGLEQSRPQLEKYHVGMESSFALEPLRLAAVYHLREARDSRYEGSELLRGLAAIRDTHDNIYKSRIAGRLNGQETLFRAVGRLCTAVPAVRLSQLRDIRRVDAMATDIAAIYADSTI